MGLERNDRNSGVTFLRIGIRTDDKGYRHAVIGKRCKATDPDAQQVFKADGEPALDKDGNNVYRQEFDKLTGMIIGLEEQESEFNGKPQKFLDIVITDSGDTYRLRLDRGDRYWTDFLMRLPMVQIGAPVTLSPYSIKNEDGKYNMGIAIRQNGEKVTRRWNKEDGYEGGPPAAEFDEDEQEWKFGKRNRWLEENVLRPAAVELSSIVNAIPPPVTAKAQAPEQDIDDDLPF